MKSKQELIDNLQVIIDRETYNKEIINKIALAFNEKGFSLQRANQIFTDAIPLESLSTVELILLSKELYNIKRIQKINPKKYFSEMELINSEKYKKPEKERKKSLVFRKVTQRGKLEWLCPIKTLYEIYDAHNNAMLSYNFKTQREPTYKKLPTGETILKATINQNSVKDIAREMYSNKYKPSTMITLNIRLIDGKKPNIHMTEDGDLVITPDYDFSSPNTTFIDVIDGWHRINGALWAVDKAKIENKQLTNSLIVSVTCLKEEDAKSFIAREAKHNDMSKEYVKSLANDNYNQLIQEINDYNEKNNIFKNKIANTDKELKYSNKIVTKEIIRKALEQVDIDINDPIDVEMNLSKFIEIITTMFSIILKYKYEGNKEEMNKSVFLEPNMFIGYFAIADELRKEKKYLDKLLSIIDKLSEMEKEDFNKMGIYNQNLQHKKIYQSFKNIIKEVK